MRVGSPKRSSVKEYLRCKLKNVDFNLANLNLQDVSKSKLKTHLTSEERKKACDLAIRNSRGFNFWTSGR